MMLDALKKAMKDAPALLATVIGTLTLAAAFISENGFGLKPCDMCWWQRYPYMAAIGACLLFHFMGERESRLSLFILALIFFVNAGLAGYHVGVEEKWWQGITPCASGGVTGTLEEMLAAIKGTSLVRCDEIQFSLFGISMAGYNFLVALSLGLFCAISGRRR